MFRPATDNPREIPDAAVGTHSSLPPYCPDDRPDVVRAIREAEEAEEEEDEP